MPRHEPDRVTPATWPRCVFDPAFETLLNAHLAYWGSEECVVLPKFAAAAMRSVTGWRRGPNAIASPLPIGTPIASFLDRQGRPSLLWDGGEGFGITGNDTTHSGVLAGYLTDACGARISLKMWEVYPGAGRVRRRIYLLDDSLFGTRNARAYHAIMEPDGAPLGRADNPFWPVWSMGQSQAQAAE